MLQQSPYCVVVQAIDPTVDMVRTMAPRSSSSATVCLLVDVSQIHQSDRPAAQALKAASGLDNAGRKRNRKNRKLTASAEDVSMSDEPNKFEKNPHVLYPHETHVRRSATPMYRVIQPINMLELVKRRSMVFRITDDRTGAFGITAVAGIVFVSNVTALRKSPAMVYKYLNICIYLFVKAN